MTFKAECTKLVDGKRIVFSEKRSSLTLLNPNRNKILRIKVDGCQMNDNGEKCDYLAIPQMDEKLECFIELKGQNLSKATKQLERSIKHLSADWKKAPKRSYIICTRSPLASAEIQNLALKFKKKYNAKLIVKTSKYEDRLP